MLLSQPLYLKYRMSSINGVSKIEYSVESREYSSRECSDSFSSHRADSGRTHKKTGFLSCQDKR